MKSCHALILNYKRPQNIARIVRSCLASNAFDAIHVIDQASPGQQLQMLPKSKRINYVRQPNIGSGRRLLYASTLDCDLIIGIDDDVFLRPPQITDLIVRAIRLPTRVHGIWGQPIADRDGSISIEDGICNVNRAVDILNRVYAFSPAHARGALALANLLGLQRDKLGFVDDILLSFGAPGQPLCHDLGPIEDCVSSNEPGTAVWKQPGFEQNRIELVGKLKALGRLQDRGYALEPGRHAGTQSGALPVASTQRSTRGL